MKRIAKGVWIGNCPKIGDEGLIINSNRRANDWQFDFRWVRLSPGQYWFQTITDGKWDWFHGIVDQDGHIIQIG